MKNLSSLFGKSPFEPLVEHARKVHACVTLIRPIADAVLAGDMAKANELQHEMSKTEYEADLIKDDVREHLPRRYWLPVEREDMARFLSQMDKIADDAEDFAIVATFRALQVPADLHADFIGLVDKVVEVSGTLLGLAEHLAQLQRESFSGPDVEEALKKVKLVAQMEWESDKLSRRFARRYYGTLDIDPITIILLDKLCRSLGGIANHAENVGKNLRLMITRG